MKKGKKNTTYILLIFVLAIWGYLIYLIIAGTTNSQNSEIIISNFNTNAIVTNLLKDKDSFFSLELDYEDPFLGKKYIPKRKKKATVIRKLKNSKPIVKKRVYFPRITYNGYVGEAKHPTIFLVKVNNQQKMFRLNQEIEGLKLTLGDAKSITFEYQEEKKNYILKK